LEFFEGLNSPTLLRFVDGDKVRFPLPPRFEGANSPFLSRLVEGLSVRLPLILRPDELAFPDEPLPRLPLPEEPPRPDDELFPDEPPLPEEPPRFGEVTLFGELPLLFPVLICDSDLLL